MLLVPAHCRGCNRYWLQRQVDIDQQGSTFCECGAAARVLPAESYVAGDVSLFKAIVDSLEAARITALQAGRLTLELELREHASPALKLARLSELVPSLTVIQLIATTDAATTRKAVSMLTLLLETMATTRSESDVSALLSAPVPAQRKHS